MRGDTAALSCHFKVQSLNYGVQWFKMEAEKQLLPRSPRQIVVKKNRTLLITEAAPEDSGWYYCEVNVLQRDPEWGNGTELVVWAPPSPPRIYLRTPLDTRSGQWALLCLTGGFHPNKLNLTWTYQSAAANINHLSITNCTAPAINPPGNPPDRSLLSSDWLLNSVALHRSKCFQVIDNHSQDVFLFSGFLLPPKHLLDTEITFTCSVQAHPAITAPLTASFNWGPSPNEPVWLLNVLKMCVLSAATAVLLLEAVKHFCTRGKRRLP